MMLEREPEFTICGEAGSGEEALEQLATTAPDLLIVDVSLPGMDGFSLLRNVHDRWPELDGIILSGHTESIYSDQAQAVNALAYIDKANALEIVPVIRQVLAEITGSSA